MFSTIPESVLLLPIAVNLGSLWLSINSAWLSTDLEAPRLIINVKIRGSNSHLIHVQNMCEAEFEKGQDRIPSRCEFKMLEQ